MNALNKNMLLRFSLYGFLKNQKYYEPFLILAFLKMGLNFTMIGIIVAFREILINLMEVPSGAFADIFGRRRSMIISFLCYILSFSVMGICGLLAVDGHFSSTFLFVIILFAMIFFAAGEAFRTGTHKAIIFEWLSIQGRIDESTKIYGYTRSWSKMGSAVSVVFACIFVYISKNYVYIFFFSIIPYIINIFNFFGYPKTLDNDKIENVSLRDVYIHFKDSLRSSFTKPSLRRLIFESMGFEGFFKAAKDYLQPILKNAVVPLSALLFSTLVLNDEQKSVILIGPVYFILFLLSAVSSRKSHKLLKKHGDLTRTTVFLWLVFFIILSALIPVMYFGIHWMIITGFILLYIVQNLWRPVLISRFTTNCIKSSYATVLSIESQAKSASTMIIAPLLGVVIDLVRSKGIGECEFWPVAVLGALISFGFLINGKLKKFRSV